MSRRASLVHQCQSLFFEEFEQRQNGLPEERSRHIAKREGKAATGVYSYLTAQTYNRAINALLNTLERHERPRFIRDIMPQLTNECWQRLQQRSIDERGQPLSRDYGDKILAALQKLDNLRLQRGWGNSAGPLVTDELRASVKALGPRRIRGGYAAEMVEDLRQVVTETFGPHSDERRMFDLIHAAGLRAREAYQAREHSLDRENGAITVNGKGGRTRSITPRTIGLHGDNTARRQLQAAIDAIPRTDNYLWPGGERIARRLQDCIRARCNALGIASKGLHGLRGATAEAFLHRHMDAIRTTERGSAMTERQIELAARQELSRFLGHNRIGVTYSYCPRLT